jgi:hypothetical protein
VRKAKAEMQRDRTAESERRREFQRERDAKLVVRSDTPTPTPAGSRPAKNPDYTVLLGLVVVFTSFGLSQLAFLAIGKELSRFHLYWLLGPIILLDFWAWRHFTPKRRYGRYLPLVWWL